MTKLNYFDALETLANLISEGISAADTLSGESGKRTFKAVKEDCDRIVFSLEEALFSDFITPLERDNIAEFAHSLYRVLERAGAVYCGAAADGIRVPLLLKRATDLNRRLWAQLTENIELLKRLKKPDSIPDLASFRRLAGEGQSLREEILCALKAGKLNSAFSAAAGATDDLRLEIVKCFDKLVEIMLNNI